MSISTLSKVAILLPNDLVNDALLRLQQWGHLHIVEQHAQASSIAGSGAEKEQNRNIDDLSSTEQAIHYLQENGIQRRSVQHLTTSESVLIKQVLQNRQSRLELMQNMLKLSDRIGTLKPWGYFNWPTKHHLGGQRLWFYCIAIHKKDSISDALNTHIVHEDGRHCWVLVISPNEPEHDLMPFPRTHVGQRSLAELETELETAQILLEDLDDERTSMTRWLVYLQDYRDKAIDSQSLSEAKSSLIDKSNITLAYGWLETSHANKLTKLVAAYSGVVVSLTKHEDDMPPTLLKNPKSLQAAQGLVTFFQLPGYDDWDPTPVLHISFVFFYAMILADVGYGAITLLIGAWIQYKHGGAGPWANFIYQLGTASVLYGILVGSYFGVSPDNQSFAESLQFLDLTDFNQMMQLSLVVGILHLAIGLLVKAKNKPGLSRIQSLSWFWMLCCGLGYVFDQNDHWIYAGLASPVLWLMAAIKYGESILNGFVLLLSPITQLSKLFGDVLSYMRLFALGLASASLAITFNQLALDVREAFPGMGVLLSLLILLLGHGLNFSLAIMSGVVHSLRLNCIEFFNWALDKEGYPFKPFKLVKPLEETK